MDDLPGTLERLTARVETLEQRIAALEHPSPVLSAPVFIAAPQPETAEAHAFAQASGLFSVLGKAMLGIAGAYLLRAIAESTSLPRLMIAAIAIIYALLWLVAASRVRASFWLATAIYAGASALILAPMLWELTLSFKILPATATAAILCAFVIAATALAWKQNRAPLFWVANCTAAASALALSVATHQFLPFIATLLLMALLSEFAAALNHQRSLRPLVGFSADSAIWALIFIYSGPQSARMDYPSLGATELLFPACLLFLIYGVSTVLNTTLQAQKITAFEAIQAMIAYLLAASSLLCFAPRNGAVLLGALCLLFAFSSYAATIRLFGKATDARNFHVHAAWAAVLLIAGSYLCLPPFWMATFLCIAAIAATLSSSRLTWNFHGLLFLLTAALASGLLVFVLQTLAGTLPASLPPTVCLVSLCAIVCFAVGKHDPLENWFRQFLHLATAALAAFALAALLVWSCASIFALLITPQANHIAFLRSLVLCAMALALAFTGCRWHRIELTRIAYATLGLLAAKLLFEDLRQGHLAYIAAAIFLFAITLISVPRLAGFGQKS